MSIIEEIISPNNLYWAWEKTKWCYKPGDTWFNELDVAAFESDLFNELDIIKNDILSGNYQVTSIQPIPFPKSKDENGPRTRQTFWIAVRDQVTWIAVANVIGKYLDSQMPFWSYGNRLFVPVFKNDQDDTVWLFGHYRNTTKYIFRTWKQSWPLFRRHINITAKILTLGHRQVAELDLDEIEQTLIDTNERLEADHPLKVKYLEASFWNIVPGDDLFWAGIDFKTFYPNVKQDAIRKNIKEYLTRPKEKAFEDLIDRLLAFPVDYTGWSDIELKEIQLDDRRAIYENIPTGLFVAGFLANISLLKVDSIVNAKLLERKNIAHFRYVDDHVILAKSFDELVSWIEEYKQILEQENTGAIFNYEKTEPGALAKYIEAKVNTVSKEGDIPEKLEEQKAKAEQESLLDPEFPSPLMTQTLTKVSKLAHTNFQLLTPQEESTLIADVEHLLVTEFPDQELRRDTRVSFAARMLSTLVPEMSGDITILYNAKKKHQELETLLQVKQREAKNFDEKEQQASLMELIAIGKEIINQQEEIANIISALEQQENKIGARAIKLLLKSVKENHEKVRLWTRVFEFMLKMGIKKSKPILATLTDLKEKGETNELSIQFIHALILQIISALLFQAFNLLTSDTTSVKKKIRAREFLAGILSSGTIEYFQELKASEQKHFLKISLDIFNVTTGTIIYLLNKNGETEFKRYEELINKFNLPDWKKSPAKYFQDTQYIFGTWVWWLLECLPKRHLLDSPFLWDEIQQCLTVDSVQEQNIVQLYPDQLDNGTLQKIDKQKEKIRITLNEGFLFDVWNALAKKAMPNKFKFLDPVENKMKKARGYITLCDWIDWTKKHQEILETPNEGQLIFDPRLSEWAALKITSRLIDIVSEKVQDLSITSFLNEKMNYLDYIHPNNFNLPKQLTEEKEILTWEKLKTLFDPENVKISFKEEEQLIKDVRFSPELRDKDAELQSAIVSISSVLVCLLAKDYRVPPKWNPIGHQMAWVNLYKNKLKDLPISSTTRNIIDGCFSKKNEETRAIKRSTDVFPFKTANDTQNDPPEFTDLSELKKAIEESIKQLEHQQISVSQHQPRQLIPIYLKIFKRIQYQDPHANED